MCGGSPFLRKITVHIHTWHWGKLLNKQCNSMLNGTCILLLEIGVLLPIFRNILREPMKTIFRMRSQAISKSPITHMVSNMFIG